MSYIRLSRLDPFSQFLGFNGSDDQVCVRFPQPNHVIVGRCLYRLCRSNLLLARGDRLFAQKDSVFTHADSIFPPNDKVLAAGYSR